MIALNLPALDLDLDLHRPNPPTYREVSSCKLQNNLETFIGRCSIFMEWRANHGAKKKKNYVVIAERQVLTLAYTLVDQNSREAV